MPRAFPGKRPSPAGSILLFLPLWFLVPNLALAVALFALVFGNQATLWAMFAIPLYPWLHYVAHIPYVRLTKVGLRINQYHLPMRYAAPAREVFRRAS